ncbi:MULTISPECIES: ring-opening amidohydrolase [unclassified Bradyrhizobium]|uniref:cyanuric acid amidohydrolase n=1 Tax=unclassified Bradyrhizobium TaxID=2631580 RepID=UPI002304E9D6|nr:MULTISPECIES: ring-opening amidohydrolase [unclassified Bradyrhizobium]MDA9407986.1 cyanuric acid amidohydrolase [Bradyrhizobium sp. CCBAU 45384]MDA9441306.1 cyanuric acid amidohydrolase [Bradyrhizobium sp. CCBAU 51745]
MRTARVFRLSMAHPGDLSELDDLIVRGTIKAADVAAIIGKTEGNGGVNDFTRGYFTQTLMALLSKHLGRPAAELIREIPCVLSGGTEGVMSPHYSVFCVSESEAAKHHPSALAIGTAFSAPVAAEEVGRRAHVESVAATVRAAMSDAGIERIEDVHFVQVKCPCVTVARATAAIAAGKTPLTSDPNKSMAFARAAGAFGVALALSEIGADDFTDASLLADFSIQSPRASISSGVEVESNEVVVLGNSPNWAGNLRIAHRPMSDALDIGAVVDVLADLGIAASPQVSAADWARIASVLVKCEPDRRGRIRGHRHTMLDDTDINAQRHIRGAVAGLVAGVIGDGRIFVSGGAEHQGPDGGGLIAVIASQEGAG